MIATYANFSIQNLLFRRESENPFLKGNFDQASRDPVVDSRTELKREHTHINNGFISLNKYSPNNSDQSSNNIPNENQILFKGGQRRGVIHEKKKMSNEDSDLESSESKKKNVFDSIKKFLMKKKQVSSIFKMKRETIIDLLKF